MYVCFVVLDVDGSSVRLAKLKANTTFTAPCDSSVLYPTSGGNIHEFTAITPCAVIDVIGPPYSKDDGRDCTHYQEVYALLGKILNIFSYGIICRCSLFFPLFIVYTILIKI